MKKTIIIVAGMLVLAGVAYAATKFTDAFPMMSNATTTAPSVTAGATTTVLSSGITPHADAGPQPTCTITLNKAQFTLTDPVIVSWTSTGATKVSFDQSYSGPPGSSQPPLPKDEYGPTGSATITGGISGYVAVRMQAVGPGGTGYCTTQYFARAGDVVAGLTSKYFGTLPTTISYSSTERTAISADGTLSITIEGWSIIRDKSGTVSGGTINLTIKDGKNIFPIFLVVNEPQKVILSSGAYMITGMSPSDKEVSLKIVRAQ